MNIEEKLYNMDFAQHSKVRNLLLLKLLNRRKSQTLSMKDLDMVVAAGNPAPTKIEYNDTVKKQ